MTLQKPLTRLLTIWALTLTPVVAWGQTFRASFDTGVKAELAAGRAEPWVQRDLQLVPGKFGKAAQLGPRGQLTYGGEQNVLAGRGTLAFWCRIPERPGPLDIQRLIFLQAKERGYWNYLATLEWQEGAFRAMVFDFYHGHGWHDPAALPDFTADGWHHLALVWDQAEGVKFFLDGKLAGSTWRRQAWWERPTPHGIHLAYPGATYDELCIYDRALRDDEVAALARSNQWELPSPVKPLEAPAREQLASSLSPVGLRQLPAVEAGKPGEEQEHRIRLARPRQILDDRIPAWKVMDGRMDLFWPEWRSPTLGDVDFSGSEINVSLQPGEHPTHLVLRGLVGGCRVYGERDGFQSREPVLEVPTGLHFLAAGRLPANLSGIRLPRQEAMKLQEIGLYTVEAAADRKVQRPSTPISGPLTDQAPGSLTPLIHTRTLPFERSVFGPGARGPQRAFSVAGLSRVHFLTGPESDAVPLDAVSLQLRFTASWKEDVWWLRVQDPVNPRRDLIHLPVRVHNPSPGEEAACAITLDFWDIMLDPGSQLWIELLPTQNVNLKTGDDDGTRVALVPGERQRVLADFAHTQSQLAFSYWQLGSEAGGTQGADPNNPSFNLLGGITHNLELRLTLASVRRHVPDQPLVNNLWRITQEKATTAPVEPRLRPANAPEWAVWGREMLERFRTMAHAWADWQGPDGQIGGGWNDDTDFPGVFICLPLLGDTRTQRMFERIFDGVEKTGYLHHSVSRAPIDTLHATDFLSWRAHLMLFDYGQPRHMERALLLNRELEKWTKLDARGHRRALTDHYSEDGPDRRPRSAVDDDGSVHQLAEFKDGSIAPFTRDLLFGAWYSRNPTMLKFLREVAEGDYARAAAGDPIGYLAVYPFYSYATLFGETKYIDEPVDKLLRDRWAVPIWRRVAERLPNGNRQDAQLIKAAKVPTATDESLTAAYLATRDKSYLVRALRSSCERLEGGWQFRGGEARGANDHFNVPGQAPLGQMFLGSALTWLRPASIVPPIAVSWQGLDANAAALVLEATPRTLRVAGYNFDDRPRTVRMRVWELQPGQYRLREGADDNHDDRIDGQAATRELNLQRSTPIELVLPPQKVHIIELEQLQAQPRPELLPDLAVGDGDISYDKATDRLKVVVHNIGAAAVRDVVVRFEDPAGHLLAERLIARLDAPLDLQPKTAVVWMPQPTLHPVPRIVVRIDPEGKVDEITRENNRITWER